MLSGMNSEAMANENIRIVSDDEPGQSGISSFVSIITSKLRRLPRRGQLLPAAQATNPPLADPAISPRLAVPHAVRVTSPRRSPPLAALRAERATSDHLFEVIAYIPERRDPFGNKRNYSGDRFTYLR